MKICILTSWSPWAEILLSQTIAKFHPHIAKIYLEKKYVGKNALQLFWTVKKKVGWRLALYCGFEMVFLRVALEMKRFFGLRKLESFHDAAKRHGIAVEFVDSFNGEEFLAEYIKLSPDLACLVGVPRIIKESLIAVPKHGTINFHPGILPDYKGRLPILHTLREQRPHCAGTMHKVVAGVDSGDLIAYAYFERMPDRSMAYHSLCVNVFGSCLIADVLEFFIEHECVVAQPQKTAGQHFSWPTREQIAELKSAGHPLMQLRDLWDIWCTL